MKLIYGERAQELYELLKNGIIFSASYLVIIVKSVN